MNNMGLNKHINRIQSIVLWAVLLPALYAAINFAFVSIMPADFWFFYDKFEANQLEYGLDEPLTFTSYAEVYRPVQIEWTDILRCDYGDGYKYASVYYSSRFFEEPTDMTDGASWVWSGNPVVRPTKCYVDSSVCAQVGFGVEKCQYGRTEESFLLLNE